MHRRGVRSAHRRRPVDVRQRLSAVARDRLPARNRRHRTPCRADLVQPGVPAPIPGGGDKQRQQVGPFGPRPGPAGETIVGMIPPQTVTESLIDLNRGGASRCWARCRSADWCTRTRCFRVFDRSTFVLQTDGVYLRTSDDGEVLQLAEDRAQVVFEADGYDAGARFGWSVVVLGQLERVHDLRLLDRLANGALTAWADGRREVVRVSLGQVSGRRAGGVSPPTDSCCAERPRVPDRGR